MKEFVESLEHIGIPTKKLEKTIEFYKSLGFEVIYENLNTPNVKPTAFLKLSNIVIETWQTEMAVERYGAVDHFAIAVNDIDAAFNYISKNNFKLCHDKVQFLPHWENGVRFFTIEGPNAEKIEFSQKNEASR